MQYRKFGNTGFEISALGFGAMRLPVADVPLDGPEPDLEPAIDLLCRGFEAGINYVDTAYFYLRGWSEIAVGRAVKRNHWRDRVRLSTKLPLGELKCADDFWRILENQLRKLDTDHIDFYHFHGIGESALSGPIREFRLFEQAAKARDRGMIRHLSFSFHDRPAAMKTLIDTGEFSSVLFQYNLLDVANAEMIAYAAGKGLGTVAMGPVGGGRLAFAGGVFEDALGGKFTTPEFALRFVLANPAVSCALSGMGSAAMVDANTRVASDADPLTEPELAALVRVREQCGELRNLYCTGCNYCGPSCPEHVRIPAVLEALIYDRVYGFREHARSSYARIGSAPDKEERNASACVGCGLCESKCPQKLPIRKHLAEARALFEG